MLLAAGVAEVIERAFNLQEEICHSGADCCSRLSPASLHPTRADYLVLYREGQSPTPLPTAGPETPSHSQGCAWSAVSGAAATSRLPHAQMGPRIPQPQDEDCKLT